MGLGQWLTYDVAKHVVPRLPSGLQRFHPASDWNDAEGRSKGYAAAPLGQVTTPSLPLILNPAQTRMAAFFGVAYSASETSPRSLRVLDFGGFNGAYSLVVGQCLPAVDLRWTVVELPEVIQALATTRGMAEGVDAISDLEAALKEAPDVILASGALHYTKDPISLLKQFLRASPTVILTRLPLWPIPEHHVAVQRTQTRPVEISYPMWFLSEPRFRSELAGIADVLFECEVPEDRASFLGHFGTYRGLVLRSHINSSVS